MGPSRGTEAREAARKRKFAGYDCERWSLSIGDALEVDFWAAPGLSAMSLTPEHLPPVTGIVYDVHVASDGTDLFRVLTSRQETSIPGPLWAGWAGKTVTVDLIKAPLIRNTVSDGPYRAATLTISITP